MKLLIVGDSHADPIFIKLMQQKGVALNCDLILQLGDFGYFPHLGEGLRFIESIKGGPLPIYFLAGNHDDHRRLAPYRHSPEPVTIADNIFYLPQGYRWSIGVWNLMALGGATSIDRGNRVEGMDWFPNESISYADAERALNGEPVDILFSHECPSSVEPVVLRGRYDLGIGKSDRRTIQEVVDQLGVTKVFHGHWHHKHETVVGKTTVVGLDCNLRPQNSWTVLEL